ncbi:MAG: WD40 repeat domain-containing protein [Ktedonobacteraceae bacterium]|nr:WD40 repeat domain-containing protein [Ktedonobacteraceae bacterium]
MTRSIPKVENSHLECYDGQITVQRLSRRRVLTGLGGLVLMGSGMSWLEGCVTGSTSNSTPNSRPTFPPTRSKVLYIYRGHTDIVSGIAWSPDGQFIASASLDRTVQVWKAVDGMKMLTLTSSAPRFALAWSPDGKFLVSSGAGKIIEIWNVTNGKLILSYKRHTDEITGVAWSVNGKYLASSSADTTVQIWEATTGKRVLIYKGHFDSVLTVDWSPDGKYLVSGSLDGTVQIWETVNGKHRLTYKGAKGLGAVSGAWSPDGTRIASAVNVNKEDEGLVPSFVEIWNASTGKTISSFAGASVKNHSQAIVAWSPDGRRVVASGTNGTAQLHDAATGNILLSYNGHTRFVTGLAWARDGKRIASASEDKTVQIWQV